MNETQTIEPQSKSERQRRMRGLGRTFKRGSVCWIAYNHRGREYREPARDEKNRSTETIAQKLLKKRLGEIGRGKLIGPVEERVTFAELSTTYALTIASTNARPLKPLNIR